MTLFDEHLVRPETATPPVAVPPAVRRPFIAAFESTYLPGHDVDVAESTAWTERWRDDIAMVAAGGVDRARIALRWHRIESEPGQFDWTETDRQLLELRRRGIAPIVDLVHHTSYPDWLSDGFRDPRFPDAYLRFAEAVARRYDWIPAYTLFNEPFATLFLAGHEALWPPYDRGVEGFVRLALNVLPAVARAAESYTRLLPDAEHVWVDTCESHRGDRGGAADYARLAEDRKHVILDLMLGHDLDPERPFLAELVAAGGAPLLQLPPVRVDVLGLDYYPQSEWWYDEHGGRAPSPHPRGFAALAREYASRYPTLPLMLTETNVRGTPTDRASWLRHMLEEYELAVAEGVDLTGFCWFPTIDSTDWDSLLARPAGRVDPVGVVSLDEHRRRIRTEFTMVWEAAAAGAPVASLPAYRFRSPCAEQLEGLLPRMAGWNWIDAEDPQDEPSGPTPDLVVLSHLRWNFVWQRPQHLVSRFAADRAAAGARTWFVEEPLAADIDEPELVVERAGDITRIWLLVPALPGQPELLGFDAIGAEGYGELLLRELEAQGAIRPRDVLMYTPMALHIARMLAPNRLAYDVMDDLASFDKAPAGLRDLQRELLAEADVVYAGGRSLHEGVLAVRPDCHLFPSGVDVAHYATSRALRDAAPARRPVAGYVGVIDERMDLELLAALAADLPDWIIRVVGPTAKISPEQLPVAPNIEYPGMATYDRLPAIMAGFDVALMPFALNEATRSISPTKTLEYLAAGLPVVSTRVADVVAGYQGSVAFADTAEEFAQACRRVIHDSPEERDRRCRSIREQQSWDTIAASMAALLDERPPRWARAVRTASRPIARDLESAHHAAAGAAEAGMRDVALGDRRLQGQAEVLAHAAVSSATPFLRAPLLARLSTVSRLHPPEGDADRLCPSCGIPAPCPTAQGVA
jgi:glycosyltransferase involved in cell wall biosynthesis